MKLYLQVLKSDTSSATLSSEIRKAATAVVGEIPLLLPKFLKK